MIRVRFAPSPTGQLHIGNARTALFNWLFARHNNGKFILRIEDTDLARSEVRYTDQILSDLRWLGLSWDEGPDTGGEYGPYIQSERTQLYAEYIKKLIKEEKAYECYCTLEELEQRRQQAIKEGRHVRYDNRCRDLTQEQKQEFGKKGIKPVIRFKIREGSVEVDDLIRGRVRFDTAQFGDIIIQRSDGTPSFHFTVCLDDMLMKISHVIRGEDHLPNTPKHILFFEAFGAEAPKYAHLPMIMGKGSKTLSKREGASSIAEYCSKGYLAQTLVNYMTLLGWASKTGREILKIEDIIKEFDIKDVNKSSAVFDDDKLNWMSGQYIREADINQITDMAIPYLKKAKFIEGEIDEDKYEWLKQAIDSVRDHINYLSEITIHMEVFFRDISIVDNEAVQIIQKDTSKQVLNLFEQALEKSQSFDEGLFKSLTSKIQKSSGIKGKDFYMPLRIALTGHIHGPELMKVAPVLGKDECIKRLKNAQAL